MENNFNLILLATVILTLLGIVVVYLNLSNQISNLRKNFSGVKYRGNQEAMPNYLGEIKKLDQRISRLEDKTNNANVKSELVPDKVILTKKEIIAEEKSPVVTFTMSEKPKKVELFMSTPNIEGSFDTTYISDVFRPTISLYKFTLDTINNQKATFEFNSDDIGTSDALNNPKTFIEPVCYEMNDSFPGARQIITVESGVAEKRNDKWVVITKAQIKYQ